MPKVGKKSYPYTKTGRAAAKKERQKNADRARKAGSGMRKKRARRSGY